MPTHKNTLRLIVQTGLTVCLLLLPIGAMAQGMTFPSGLQEGIASWTVFLISAMNLLTWIIFIYLTILLDPEFIFNTQNGEGFVNVLNNIWMLSRDLINIGFALALIGAAIYTIITAKKDFVAQHIKTFVLAVVLVNFSWFIPRVIIDVGNVAASAIYGVPSLLQTNEISKQCRFTTTMKMGSDVECKEIPPAKPGDATRYDCQCAMLVNAVFFQSEEIPAADDKTKNAAWTCPLGKTMCLHFVNLDVNTVAGHSAVLNGLIVNHARLQGLTGVSPEDKGGSEIGSMIQFMLRQVIVLAIHVALFFPLAAMAVAFAVRIPVLWITIAFMPFALLKFVLPGNYGEYPQKIWDAFLKAAFLPAIVAVPLAVGFILVNAGAQMINATPVLEGLGGVEIRIADGVSDMFELLWLGLTLGVLYLGVFMALDKVPFAAPVTNFIKDMGKNLGSIALKAPLSFPIIPGPGGGKMTPLGLLNLPKSINYGLSSDPRGLPGVLADLRRGGAGGAFETAGAAKDFAQNRSTDELVKLNDKIAELTTQLGRGEQPDLGRFESELRNLGVKISIDKNNPEQSLRAFATELGKHSNVDRGALSGLNTSLDALRAAYANRAAPAAPATPPPAPATPPATPPPANP